MRPSQVKQVIRASTENYRFSKDSAPPIFMEGPPGVGKSALAREVDDEIDATMKKSFIIANPKVAVPDRMFGWLDTRASQHDPTDFRGIPAIVDGLAKWLAPADIPFVGNSAIPEFGIWFLDEVTSAAPLVQAVLYQGLLDHAIGEHTLKPGWYIMAAGNRIEDRAVTYRMSSALANRFTHLTFEVNLDDWIDWAKKAMINPNIIMFLKFKPGMLFTFNAESSEKAFCSPRTWDFASRHIMRQPPKLLQEVLAGTLGKGATAEFMSFLQLQTELPDIDTIFKGSDFVPKRLDLTYALVGALANRAKGVKEFERMIQYAKNLELEFSVLLVTMLAQKDPGAMALAPSFEKWALSNADVIRKVK